MEEIQTSKEKEANGHLKALNGLDPSKLEKEQNKGSKLKPSAIILSGVTASWQPDAIRKTLKNINLTIQPGEFLGVVGLVGSGKVNDLLYCC